MVQSSSKPALALGANQILERPDHARGALVSTWRVPLDQKASASTSGMLTSSHAFLVLLMHTTKFLQAVSLVPSLRSFA